ncbi:unnamed protein product (macronuclear) [Paramecium tetraurelia]|uniref:Protein kinase domain-containing protein n=1 Tax=Paramecium tetraurelia TaxID=5888 RepID=A0DH50_PARTE|nr:uncharacterized protein GSPATT00016753001 [Paramecium tetraurelia]CAK82367.1 unnamed protein product [Paramecium tetraurelia]|eukprot:XP_001449764.1 hypothetical protein (macronuclear) [Paramecium tetraurelia strain d4-2]
MNYDVRTIGDYEVHFVNCIGQGSYGKVYEGRIISQNRKICAKVLHMTEEKREMFQREVKTLEEIKKVTHPNILKIYHIAEQNQKIYIFMEKCIETLEQKMKSLKDQNQSFSADQVLLIAKQICRGYNELRKKNIIHRDIKPDNILIGEDGQYKISDYGLSKTQNDIESILKQTQLGTPLFVSPQVFKGEYSNKADLFSLGLTIYYITFQEPIFKIKTLGELSNELNKIKKGLKLPQIKNQGDLNSKKYLEDFLKKTIAYEEDERVSWDELSRYLDQININSSISKAPPEQDGNKNIDTLGINLQRVRQRDTDSVIYSIKPAQQEKTQTQEQQPLEPVRFMKNTNQDSRNINQGFQQDSQIKQNQDYNNRQISNYNQTIDNRQVPQYLDTQLIHQQINLIKVQDTPKDFINSDVCDSQFDQSKQNNSQKQNNNPNIIKQTTSNSQYSQEIIFRRDFQENQNSRVAPQNNNDEGLKIGCDNDSQNSANQVQKQFIFNNPDQSQNQIHQVIQLERKSDQKDFYIKNDEDASESIINFNNIDPYQDENQFQIQNELLVSKQNNQKFDEYNCHAINYNTNGKNNQFYDHDDQLSLNQIDSQSEVISDSYKLSETTQREYLNTQNNLKQTSDSLLFQNQETFNQGLKVKNSIRSQFRAQQPNQITQIKFSSTNKIQSTCASDMIPQNKINNQTTNLAQFKNVKQNQQAQYEQQVGLKKKQEIQPQDLQKDRGFQKQIQSPNKQGNNTSYQYNQSKTQEFQNQNAVQKIELQNKNVEFSTSNDTQPRNQQLNQQQMFSKQNEKIQNGNQNDTQEQGQVITRTKNKLLKKSDASQQTQPLKQVFQIILAKIKLAENAFNSYQAFRTNCKFQEFTKQFEILNYLLHYYQYALIANVRLLLKNDKGLEECYLQTELDQIIVANSIVDYQKQNQQQLNEINEIYQEKLQIAAQASKDFQDFLDSRANNGDIMDLIRFIEEGKFFRFFSYIDFYENDLSSIELLKFFGYSIKFIEIDIKYPINKYKVIDSKQVDYLTDNLETLQEFIKSYMKVK